MLQLGFFEGAKEANERQVRLNPDRASVEPHVCSVEPSEQPSTPWFFFYPENNNNVHKGRGCKCPTADQKTLFDHEVMRVNRAAISVCTGLDENESLRLFLPCRDREVSDISGGVMFDWGLLVLPVLFPFVNRLPGNVVIIIAEASICSF